MSSHGKQTVFRTRGMFQTAGAPYLAFFWRDVGSNECWQESVDCV
jgi:hypothetical protein